MNWCVCSELIFNALFLVVALKYWFCFQQETDPLLLISTTRCVDAKAIFHWRNFDLDIWWGAKEKACLFGECKMELFSPKTRLLHAKWCIAKRGNCQYPIPITYLIARACGVRTLVLKNTKFIRWWKTKAANHFYFSLSPLHKEKRGERARQYVRHRCHAGCILWNANFALEKAKQKSRAWKNGGGFHQKPNKRVSFNWKLICEV